MAWHFYDQPLFVYNQKSWSDIDPFIRRGRENIFSCACNRWPTHSKTGEKKKIEIKEDGKNAIFFFYLYVECHEKATPASTDIQACSLIYSITSNRCRGAEMRTKEGRRG